MLAKRISYDYLIKQNIKYMYTDVFLQLTSGSTSNIRGCFLLLFFSSTLSLFDRVINRNSSWPISGINNNTCAKQPIRKYSAN